MFVLWHAVLFSYLVPLFQVNTSTIQQIQYMSTTTIPNCIEKSSIIHCHFLQNEPQQFVTVSGRLCLILWRIKVKQLLVLQCTWHHSYIMHRGRESIFCFQCRPFTNYTKHMAMILNGKLAMWYHIHVCL